jgi:hypothetical protein
LEFTRRKTLLDPRASTAVAPSFEIDPTTLLIDA